MTEATKEDREFIEKLLQGLGVRRQLEDVHWGSQKLADYREDAVAAEQERICALLDHWADEYESRVWVKSDWGKVYALRTAAIDLQASAKLQKGEL